MISWGVPSLAAWARCFGLRIPASQPRSKPGSAAHVNGRSCSSTTTSNASLLRNGTGSLAGTAWISGANQLLTQARVESPVAAAQLATVSKAAIELNDLRVFAKGLAPEALSEDQIEMWSAAGQVLYGIGDLRNATPRQVRVTLRGERTTQRSELPPPPRVLDETSRALVVRLHNEVSRDLRATGKQLDAMIARLEQTMVADSALNQLRLRPQIGREIVRRGGRTDFATLNAWIYAEVFRTPKEDAWLGILPRNVFTGLPGDGVVIR